VRCCGSRHIQHLHIHPRFTPDGRQVLFTADPRGYGQLFLAEVPPFEELPTLEQVSTLAPEV
jgi:oligogalacturonide lyase